MLEQCDNVKGVACSDDPTDNYRQQTSSSTHLRVKQHTVFFRSLLVLWVDKEKKRSMTKDDETWKVRSKNTPAVTAYRRKRMMAKGNEVKTFKIITVSLFKVEKLCSSTKIEMYYKCGIKMRESNEKLWNLILDKSQISHQLCGRSQGIMVWIVISIFFLLWFDPPQNLIQSRPIVGEVHHLELWEGAETMRAKYLWLNVFLPTQMFSAPVHHIPRSAPRTENWKQLEIYLWILQ